MVYDHETRHGCAPHGHINCSVCADVATAKRIREERDHYREKYLEQAAVLGGACGAMGALAEKAGRYDHNSTADRVGTVIWDNLCDADLDTLDAALGSPVSSKALWVPISVPPAPGQGVLLLGLYASGEDYFYHPCTWPPDMGDALSDVTHWMAIPERP